MKATTETRATEGRRAASERRWNQRAFVAMAAVLSGLALPLTGLFDHAAGQSPDGPTPVGWAIVHTSLGVLFAGFCTWHIVLNRRALLRYVRGKQTGNPAPTRELLAALVLVGAVLAITVTHALAEG